MSNRRHAFGDEAEEDGFLPLLIFVNTEMDRHGIRQLVPQTNQPKNMNKMMLTLAFTALMGGSLMAQDAMQNKATPGDRSEHLTEMMTKRLKLTDAQVPKVKEINDRFAKDMMAVREEHKDAKAAGTATKGDAQSKAKDLNMKKDEELKAVLTPEQMTEWQKMEAEMKARMQQKQQAKQQAKQPAPAPAPAMK